MMTPPQIPVVSLSGLQDVCCIPLRLLSQLTSSKVEILVPSESLQFPPQDVNVVIDFSPKLDELENLPKLQLVWMWMYMD